MRFGIQFRKQLKLNKWEAVQLAGVILGVYLFGTVFFWVVTALTGDETELFDMGSIMCLALVGLLMVFFEGIGQVRNFQYSISMGCTRTYYWPALAIGQFLLYVLALAEIAVLGQVWGWFAAQAWPGAATTLFGRLDWGYVLPLALAGTGVTLLSSASMIKYGRYAYFVWYFLFLAVAIGVPRLMERLEASGSPAYEQLRKIAQAHFLLLLSVGSVLIAVVCYGCSWLLIRRQQVQI